jgi:hypothetical protein
MKISTKYAGDTTETAILFALTKKGYTVSIPFGENCRYDLVVDIEGSLKKVQCKTGRLHNGCVIFRGCSQNISSGRRSYIGQIDFFGVYCLEIDRCFLIPIEHACMTDTTLRIDPPKK